MQALNVRVDTEEIYKGRGLWAEEGIPHKGWSCLSVQDCLQGDGDRTMETCQMCKAQDIRYVHIMEHPDYDGKVRAGCVCAGNMSSDYAGQQRREQKARSRSQRRARWLNRNWKCYKGGRHYSLNAMHRRIMIVMAQWHPRMWAASIDGTQQPGLFSDVDSAKMAAFDAIEQNTVKGE